MNKFCTKCRKSKNIKDFRKWKRSKDGLRRWCRKCESKYDKDFYIKNRKRVIIKKKIYANEYHRQHRKEHLIKMITYQQKIKTICINHYGGKCKCCGESHIAFLTIDHINGGGNKHRKQIGLGGQKIYRWLIKNNFPPGFQVLCFNCNCGKRVNGGICPHKMEK